MASSSSSSTLPSSSSIFVGSRSSNVIITEEEFKHFHSIDRKLFLRLVVSIGHEPREATQFMALLLWFEKMTKDFTLVSKLLQWPDALLSDLITEAALVFTCIDSDNFASIRKSNVNLKYYDLPLTQKITKSVIMTLHFFHQNRVGIKRSITDLVNGVCDRAFDDIVQYLLQKKALKDQMLFYSPMMQQGMYNVNPGFEVAMLPSPPPPPPQVVAPPHVDEGSSNWGDGLDAFDATYSKELLNNELCEILRRVELSGGGGASERQDVPADDRTIFLTFSKGYPISESEIREFFSRRYGDIIEAVIMQDVQTGVEQPLYARLVLRSDSKNVIGVILEGTRKSKFSINGKHAWARKYVRKSTKSPLMISTPESITFLD